MLYQWFFCDHGLITLLTQINYNQDTCTHSLKSIIIRTYVFGFNNDWWKNKKGPNFDWGGDVWYSTNNSLLPLLWGLKWFLLKSHSLAFSFTGSYLAHHTYCYFKTFQLAQIGQHSKGFMKFGCIKPSKIMFEFWSLLLAPLKISVFARIYAYTWQERIGLRVNPLCGFQGGITCGAIDEPRKS